ncbi:MAG: phosphoribosylformylglycinamidine synthase subunit PurQ [Methanocella sp.]
MMVTTKSQIKSLVITGYGINCEYETAYANTLAGADATIAHINDVIDGQYRLEDYQILNFPGGWSYGDDLGSGKAFANKLLYARTPDGPLVDQVLKFIDNGKLVIGICNGFQILVKMGMLPAMDKDYRTQTSTLFFNDHGFRDSWVKLKVNTKSPCVFTKGIEALDAPIRHGEGKFIPESRQMLDRLTRNGQVVLQYVDRFGRPTQEFPANPNGSMDAIAGICDETGRVFGLMPHPEAFNHMTNHPHYTRMREEAARKNLPLKEEGEGIRIWRNAVDYARQNLV